MTTVTPPLVSVIVPAFNAAKYLGAALDSLRAQTIADIEIIVVDDGSTDGTRAVAERHAAQDARVRVLKRDVPSGKPSCARNIALLEARGRYIAFLDADDVSIPGRLESAIGALELTGARFAFADVQRRYEDTGVMAPAGTLDSAHFLDVAAPYLKRVSDNTSICSSSFPAYLLSHIVINTSTVVIDRELLDLETGRFDESLVCGEDIDLWFRWAEWTPIAFVSEVHTIIRKHDASITASQPLQTHIDGAAVRKAHLDRLRPKMTPDEISIVEQNLGERQYQVAYALWSEGQGARARAWYRDSWTSRPAMATAVGYAKSFVPRARVVGWLGALGWRKD